MPGLPRLATLADRFCLPGVWCGERVAGRGRTIQVPQLWEAHRGDGGDAVRPASDTADGVVRGLCWEFATAKDGVSALSLQRTLEIGSYKTAWSMLHRLRRVLRRPGREKLAGRVEVDETYIVRP